MSFLCSTVGIIRQTLAKIIVAGLVIILLTSCVRTLNAAERLERKQQAEKILSRGVFALRENTQSSLNSAMAAFQLAKELSPNDPRIIDGIACVYWRMGDNVSAKRLFEQVSQVDPFYSQAYEHLALIAEQEGDILGAKKHLENAISLSPLNYKARNNYAVILLKEAKDAKAISAAYMEMLKAAQYNSEPEPIIEYNLRRMPFVENHSE